MNRWRHASSAEDLERVVAGLRRREWAYVPFTARLTGAAPRRPRPRPTCRILVDESGSEHPSSLLVTRSGLLLPALYVDRPLPRELRPLIYRVCGRLHSVMGVRGDVRRVQELFGRGYAVVDYLLMTVDAATSRCPARPPELRIRRGRPRDARRLFELQRAYELEEVLLDGARFNGDECLRLLRRSLQRELVYFGTIDGHPVAKAGTNARGFAVDQIGGVFTEAKRRGRGYGSSVMEALLRSVFTAGKSASLFVKPDNGAAVRLYERLGFVTRERYRICYYRA